MPTAADDAFELHVRRFLAMLSRDALTLLLEETVNAERQELVRHSDFRLWEELIGEELSKR